MFGLPEFLGPFSVEAFGFPEPEVRRSTTHMAELLPATKVAFAPAGEERAYRPSDFARAQSHSFLGTSTTPENSTRRSSALVQVPKAEPLPAPTGAAHKAESASVQPKEPPKLPAPIRELYVNRLQLLQLRDINDVTQRFSAKILFEFLLLGGAKDPDLVRKKEVKGKEEEYLDIVPKDTLRPTAMWYLKQFDITNATHMTVLDQKVVEQGDNL